MRTGVSIVGLHAAVFAAIGCVFSACGGTTAGDQNRGAVGNQDASPGAASGASSGGATSGGGRQQGGAAGAGQANGGALPSGGSGGQANPDDAGTPCLLGERRSPCNDSSIECIVDLRAVKSRFPTCSIPWWVSGVGTARAFLMRCGDYDGITMQGIDSAFTYYFDHSDGTLRGFGETGFVPPGPNCVAFDPSFRVPECVYPPQCEYPDGGDGALPACNDPGPVDAGAPPAFCPMLANPQPVPGTLPTPQQDATTLVLKFVEGAHVRMAASTLAIDSGTMLAEDPGLLRCAHLTVDAAVCSLAALNAVFAADPTMSVTRLFTRPAAELDAERASGRASGGQYLNDLNLYYFVRAPEEKTPALYDVMAANPVVDTVYYQPKPVPPI